MSTPILTLPSEALEARLRAELAEREVQHREAELRARKEAREKVLNPEINPELRSRRGVHYVSARPKAIKVTIVLDPKDITPAPAGAEVDFVARTPGGIKVVARLNPKSYRKAVAKVAEIGEENAVVIAQGHMTAQGLIEGCGIVVQSKATPASGTENTSTATLKN